MTDSVRKAIEAMEFARPWACSRPEHSTAFTRVTLALIGDDRIDRALGLLLIHADGDRCPQCRAPPADCATNPGCNTCCAIAALQGVG